MKFITEEYLKDVYRKEPFNIYELNNDKRLTPGARQYLLDKGIKILDDVSFKNNKSPLVKQTKALPEVNKRNLKKLYLKLKVMEALFLAAGSEIIKENIILAQNIINLSKNILAIRNYLE